MNDDDGLSRPFVSTAATIVVLFARMLEWHTVVYWPVFWETPPVVVDVPRLFTRLKKEAHGFLLAVLAFCFPTCASFVLWTAHGGCRYY